jgi:hypothetical protein
MAKRQLRIVVIDKGQGGAATVIAESVSGKARKSILRQDAVLVPQGAIEIVLDLDVELLTPGDVAAVSSTPPAKPEKK